MADVFAFAVARAGELRKVALEAVTAARRLADAAGGEVHALLVGAPGIAAKAEQLAADVTSFDASGDAIIARHPGYTGKVIFTVTLAASPAIISLRPGAVTPAQNRKPGRVDAAQPVGDPGAARVIVTEMVQGSSA